MSVWAQGFSYRMDAPQDEPPESPQLEQELVALLASTADLRLGTHMIHFNIKGVTAYQNHLLAERIYESLNEAVDEVGEHIRSMGVDVPNSTRDLIEYSILPPLTDASDPDVALPELAAACETLRDAWNEVGNEADDLGDQLTVDLAGGQARLHAKNAYFVNSIIQKAGK